jgi:alpha-beta hydrolase superfamily lysophospholipase
MLYWTTGLDGAPAIASGTVLAPTTPPPGPRPVVAVAHGTTGVDRACAPSLLDAPFSDGAGAALQRMVANGWVGVTSDYVGLGTGGTHPYLAGEVAARNVLDAVRAARALPGLDLDPRIAVWGHSQGGQAALWTGTVAPSYAPDVAVIGVAAFAPATDLGALGAGVRDTLFGRIVLAYLAATWTAIDPGIAGLIAPGAATLVPQIGSLCFGGRDLVAAAALSSQMFGPVFREDAFDGPLGERLRAMSPNGRIDAPVLIAQGGADQLVLAERQRSFVRARCAAGQAIDYREYAGRDHLGLVAAGSPFTPELVAWTEARLRGEPAGDACASVAAESEAPPLTPALGR